MPSRISAEEAGGKLDELLEQVSSGNGAVTIERKGKPLAVLITPEQWERYQKLSKEDFFRVVDDLRRENQDKDPEEVYREVTAVVEEVRQQRYEREQQKSQDRG